MTIQLDRLTRLTNVLEREKKLDRYIFDLRGWGYNTRVCAIGLALATEEFVEEGFSSITIGAYIPNFKYQYSWDAVCDFFGLTIDEAGYLFSSREYTPQLIGVLSGWGACDVVIQRIQKFVVDHQPEKAKPVVQPQQVLEPA